MPQLLIFLACEKVITSTEGTITAVTILERLDINLPAEAKLPERAAVPMYWSTLTVWHWVPEDEGLVFEQTVQMVTASGEVAMHSGPTDIKVTSEKPRFRVTEINHQVPITDGNLTLKLMIREKDKEWIVKAEYPIEVAVTRGMP